MTAKPASGSFSRLRCGAHALGVLAEHYAVDRRERPWALSSRAYGRVIWSVRPLGRQPIIIGVSIFLARPERPADGSRWRSRTCSTRPGSSRRMARSCSPGTSPSARRSRGGRADDPGCCDPLHLPVQCARLAGAGAAVRTGGKWASRVRPARRSSGRRRARARRGRAARTRRISPAPPELSSGTRAVRRLLAPRCHTAR